MSYTEDVVAFVTQHGKESLPEEVKEHAKIFILDAIGCAVGGCSTGPGKEIVSLAKEFKGAGEATLFGDGTRVSAPFACWANSSLANVLDMDDVFAGRPIRPIA